jgi:hypothetical protein
MTNVNAAIAFVRQHGDQLDKLRLSVALGEPVKEAEAGEILSPLQFQNGSWDYETREETVDRVGSLGGTIQCLRWIREFRLGNSRMMAHTLDFLESIQSPDGSFYETEEKLAHSPHAWLQEETLVDRFYFTAAVPMRLFSVGLNDHPTIDRAIQWLERHWHDWELVTGTWYNLWALLCLYPIVGRLSASQHKRCYTTALEWLPNLEVQPLTWLLDALQGAGFTKAEPLVSEGIARLIDLQGENGLWVLKPNSAIETTITALRLILDFG